MSISRLEFEFIHIKNNSVRNCPWKFSSISALNCIVTRILQSSCIKIDEIFLGSFIWTIFFSSFPLFILMNCVFIEEKGNDMNLMNHILSLHYRQLFSFYFFLHNYMTKMINGKNNRDVKNDIQVIKIHKFENIFQIQPYLLKSVLF